MTYDEIIEKIRSGLTGDVKADIKYLNEQAELYKNHELSQEILRGCGRLIASIIPEDAKEEINKLVHKEEITVESILDEMHYAVYKKDFKRAIQLVEPLVQKADENPMFKDDTLSAYFDFREFFEEAGKL